MEYNDYELVSLAQEGNEEAIDIIHKMSGIQFDPEMVEAFDSIIDGARAELKAYEEEDVQKLIDFMMSGN